MINIVSNTYTVGAGTTQTGTPVSIAAAGGGMITGVVMATKPVVVRVYQGSGVNNSNMESVKSYNIPGNSGVEGRGTPISIPVTGVECRVDISNQGTSSSTVELTVNAQPSNTSSAYQPVNGLLSNISAGTIALVDGATVPVNAALGAVFELVTAASRTLAAPTNAVDAQQITILVSNTSGSTVTPTLTSGTGGYDVGGFTVSAIVAGKVDVFQFLYNATLSKWLLTGYVKGY